MSLLERLKEMMGLTPKPKPDYVGPEVSRAVQRNEQASVKVREALKELKMADTLRDIAGKMK